MSPMTHQFLSFLSTTLASVLAYAIGLLDYCASLLAIIVGAVR